MVSPTLLAATDAHFAWMLGEADPPGPLRLPPGGVDEAWVLRWLRRNLAAGAASWLILDGEEVAGLCSHKTAPDAEGAAEIGYATAPAHRRRQIATLAIALLAAQARADPRLRTLTAETATTNRPSQRVLEANGFEAVGGGFDADEGEMIRWRLAVDR